MKRLLFVCGEGHIFRSLVKLKNGRLRQCPTCAGVVADDRSASSIWAARKLADKSPAGRNFIHVFTEGRVRSIPIPQRSKAA